MSHSLYRDYSNATHMNLTTPNILQHLDIIVAHYHRPINSYKHDKHILCNMHLSRELKERKMNVALCLRNVEKRWGDVFIMY